MQQLSGADTAFLYAEHGNTFNHVATLAIYDPSSHPRGKLRFKEILAHFEAHLDVHPVFRRRLEEVPLRLDRPYWVEEGDVDVEFHVRHIALPDPGDWRQLMIQVARLHSRPLDRTRPLWEVYVIDRLDGIPGLPAGCFAMFSKFHHASVDGMAALHLISTLHGQTLRRQQQQTQPIGRWLERAPGPLEITARAFSHSVGRSLATAQLTVGTVGRIARTFSSPEAGELLGALRSGGQRAPRTRFSGRISAHRVVEGLGIPLTNIKAMRTKIPGATVNDFFLAAAGGSLRKYLQASGELPQEPLRALMPISLRADGAAGGNDVTGVSVAIATHIADPLERLRVVHDEARRATRDADLLGRDLLKRVLDLAPTAVSELLMNRVMLPQLNTAVSNVRGPEGPLYLAGARLMRIYPVSIPADHAGINHTAVSYGGYFWIGVVSCREMLPDPGFYMSCLREGCNELLNAAGIPSLTEAAFSNSREPRGKTPRPGRARSTAAHAPPRRSARLT